MMRFTPESRPAVSTKEKQETAEVLNEFHERFSRLAKCRPRSRFSISPAAAPGRDSAIRNFGVSRTGHCAAPWRSPSDTYSMGNAKKPANPIVSMPLAAASSARR